MSVASQLRRVWRQVHLWLGLILLLLVGLLGFSGTVLTFQEEFERGLNPARYAVSTGATAAPSVLLEGAQSAVGERFVVASLRFPEHAGDPVIAQARAKGRPIEGQPPQSRRLWLDPASGRVLDSADPRGGFFGVMHQLHGSLLIPEVGRKVVGWMGWSLLVSALTGLWLWWPRGGAFWRAFQWRRGPLFTFNFHHFAGFWLAIPLAILAATGVYISFPQSARALTQWLTHAESSGPQQRGEGGPQRGGGAPLAHTALSIDDAAAIARAAAPGAQLSALTLPTRPRGDDAPKWRAELRAPDSGQTIQVSIDDSSGEAARRNGGGGAQDGVALTMRRVHDGRDQAVWWRVLIAIAGLAPALLGITGCIMWLRGNAAKRAVRTATL